MPKPNLSEILAFDPYSEDQDSPISSQAGGILSFDPQEEQQERKQPSGATGSFDRLSWKEALTEGFQNMPESALDYGKNMAAAVIHPIQTTKALGRIGAGAAQVYMPGEQKYEKDLDAVIDFFAERYGSVEKFKQTLAKDPMGVLADAASVATGGGSIVGSLGRVGKVGAITKAGGMIKKAGMMSEPLNVARGIAALPLKLVPEKIPMKMYKSAVKFGTTLSQKERNAVTKTALAAKNQIMPTERGMVKLRDMINGYNDEINKIINASTKKGDQINVGRLFSGLDKLKNEFKRVADNPRSYDTAFKAIKKEWIETIKVGPLRTPQEIQKIKTRIYRDLEKMYEKHKSTPAKTELRKAVAKNARKLLEDIIPEIKKLNKEEGVLIELWDAIESKANRITNRDFISIGLPIKMGTGAGIGGMVGGAQGVAIGTTLGFFLGVFDTPQVKTKIALVLNRLTEKGIDINYRTVARLGLHEAGKLKEESE